MAFLVFIGVSQNRPSSSPFCFVTISNRISTVEGIFVTIDPPSRTVILLLGLLFALTSISAQDKAKLKALIIMDKGHGIWPKTTVMMKRYLEQTELFSVDVERTVFTWQEMI